MHKLAKVHILQDIKRFLRLITKSITILFAYISYYIVY